ncbi:uncharacterized protein isoform X2 [Rhodnius prolixus]|uniref:uncharacterized protein isoform X2 n=1 Tax=Rhodnius prolixus TaxID=13249 RepID=UPI003D18E3AF
MEQNVAIESYYGGFSEEDELYEQRKQNRLRRKRLFAARSTSPKPSTAEGGGPDCKRQRLQLQIPPVNQSQPITRIQIQLPGDIIAEVYLNYSHTIGHLRTALIIKFPALKNYVFSLSLMEPPRKLLFNESTLGEEGVINCPVVLTME